MIQRESIHTHTPILGSCRALPNAGLADGAHAWRRRARAALFFCACTFDSRGPGRLRSERRKVPASARLQLATPAQSCSSPPWPLAARSPAGDAHSRQQLTGGQPQHRMSGASIHRQLPATLKANLLGVPAAAAPGWRPHPGLAGARATRRGAPWRGAFVLKRGAASRGVGSRKWVGHEATAGRCGGWTSPCITQCVQSVVSIHRCCVTRACN